MGYEVTGKLHRIDDTQQVSERFTKREFVLAIDENPKYPQLVQFQLTGERVALLDSYDVGDRVIIEFSLRGREWKSPKGEVKFFNSLDVWRVELAVQGQQPRGEQRRGRRDDDGPPAPDFDRGARQPGPDDDLPFAACDIAAEPSAIAPVLRRSF